MAAGQRRKPHAILLPLPYQGHITPFINLALKFASKGFAVTFIHFEFIHHIPSITHDTFFSEARESGLDIRYATISDGFPVDFDRVLHREEYWESLLLDFPVIVDEFLGKLIESDSSLTLTPFLVTDTLHALPETVAKKHGLVNVSFWTQPALVFSLNYHCDSLRQNGHFPCREDEDEEIDYIPGVDSICTKDLMAYFREAEMTSITPKVAMKSFEQVKKADLILHNTVYELEHLILSALNQNQKNYAIGPISFSPFLPTIAKNPTLWPESDCAEWLKSKPPGSVLYVSFGSLVSVDEAVIKEVAHGLLLSGVAFIWVARADMTIALPEGFHAELKDRGMMTSWCNQIRVLSNPSVGGFLTHCGWNSVLESIWCGVPMICHPLYFEQPVNRKLVVNDWKIGVNLSDGKGVHREEVAENVRKLMSGAASESLRKETRKMKAVLHEAMQTGGSSDMNFEQFLEDLKSLLGV